MIFKTKTVLNKMKRSRSINSVSLQEQANNDPPPDINPDFIEECEVKFYRDPKNVICRNAVVAIGSMLTTINSNHLNTIDHVFMNSIKKRNIKATNQGRSGRCWIFSAMNMFRHSVINALELDNFEFSETYLFFWDKMERANRYIRWFIDHPEVEPSDDSFKFMVEDFTSDGGWWNMVSNLIQKYGLVPKSAMRETFQSDDSEDMNQILNTRLQACANYIYNNKNLTNDELNDVREETMTHIYSTLVKFLGEPPKSFRWSYTNDEGESAIIADLKPKQFMSMVVPGVDINDFVVLTHLPGKLKERHLYNVKYTSNVYEGKNFEFLNLPLKELVKYTSKSILSGFPVWFAADVSKDFNPYHSTLDDKLVDESSVFGHNHPFTKGDKITFRNLSANHAMCLVGLNLGPDNKPESWQVENSWGYWDNETPGEDGFLYMSQSWFENNVMQVVVHKNYLTRTVRKLLTQTPTVLDPWDCVAPALKVKPVDAPRIYETIKEKRRKY
jgi:bleomycin hydrolase